MCLEKKVIIVTGGSGLIGKSIIARLRKNGAIGYNLDVNIDSDLDSHEIYCDVTSENSIQEAVNQVLEKHGKIDGLVNNAYPRTKDWGLDFEDIPTASWKKNIDWQLNSYFIFCQKILPIMRKQNNGSIVNIASIYGVVGNDFNLYEGTNVKPPAAYSAIKGGVINFTRYLASRYGEFNVRVNCVSPGGIFNNQDKKFVEAYASRVPLKRMGEPDDIAEPVNFMLSDGAKYITGQNILVDGGWTII